MEVDPIGRAMVVNVYCSCNSDEEGDMLLEEGDVVEVYRKDDLWCFISNGISAGYYPSSCLEFLNEDSTGLAKKNFPDVLSNSGFSV